MDKTEYENPISPIQLMWIKSRMSKRTTCDKGHVFDSRKKTHGKWFRTCSICNKANMKKANQKQYEKKQLESAKKFHF